MTSTIRVIEGILDLFLVFWDATRPESPGGRKVRFRELLGDFRIVMATPEIIDNVMDIDDEVWKSGGLTDEQIDELVEVVENKLPDGLQSKARVITLVLVEWIGQTVTATKKIVDAFTEEES